MNLNKFFREKKHKSKKGQGIVEFALAFPIMLMVIIGIFESGRLLFIYSTSVSASRAAARYGTAMGDEASGHHYLDCDGMRARAIEIGVLSGLKPSDISISYLIPGQAIPALCGTVTEDDLVFGSRIQVVAVGHFQPIPYFTKFFPDFDIVSESRRTILKGVQIGD